MKKLTLILAVFIFTFMLISCQRNEKLKIPDDGIFEDTEIQSIDTSENSESNTTDDTVVTDTTTEETNTQESLEPNIPDTEVSASTKLPTFSVETVKDEYYRLLVNGNFLISNAQEQETLDYLGSFYEKVEQPRLFLENGDYVLVYLNYSDGFLYKNDQKLGIHCSDFIDMDSLIDIGNHDSSEILQIYEESKKEICGASTNIDAMAREFILRRVSDETGYSSLGYPRFFKKNSEVLVLFEKEGIVKYRSISPIYP